MFFRRFFVLGLATRAAFAQSQDALNAPVPLLQPEAEKLSPGQIAEKQMDARAAQGLGLDSVAAETYSRLLEQPGTDRTALTLALATVLLDDGKGVEAERVLQNVLAAQRNAAWHLRAGLAAGLQKNHSKARAEFDAITNPG